MIRGEVEKKVVIQDKMGWCEPSRVVVVVAGTVHTIGVSVMQANEKRRFEEERTANSRGRSRQQIRQYNQGKRSTIRAISLTISRNCSPCHSRSECTYDVSGL